MQGDCSRASHTNCEQKKIENWKNVILFNQLEKNNLTPTNKKNFNKLKIQAFHMLSLCNVVRLFHVHKRHDHAKHCNKYNMVWSKAQPP
jgi:hypothetical protein